MRTNNGCIWAYNTEIECKHKECTDCPYYMAGYQNNRYGSFSSNPYDDSGWDGE